MSMHNHPDSGYEKYYRATATAGDTIKASKGFVHTVSWEAAANIIAIYDGAVAAPNLVASINAALLSGSVTLDCRFTTSINIVTTAAGGVTVAFL